MFRRLALNNMILVLQYGASSLVPLALLPHIIHAIGLTQYGALAIALAWSNYAASIVGYAFQLSGPRQLAHLAPGESEIDVACRIGSAKLLLLGVVICICLSGVAIAALAGYKVSSPQIWLLLIMPIAATFNSGWFLQALERFTTTSLLSVIGTALSLAFGFLAVGDGRAHVVGFSALALSIGALWAGVTTFIASMRVLANQLNRRASPMVHLGWRSPWSELRIGWPLFASQFTSALYTASGPIVIALLAGAREAGAYSAIERVANAISGVLILTHTAAYPKLARLYSVDRPGYFKLLRLVMLVYGIGVFGVIVMTGLAWRPALTFLLGVEGSDDHKALLAVALLWISLGIMGSVLTGYFTVSGQGHRVLPLTAAVLLLAITFGVPGTIFFGSWAWMAALCVSQVLVIGAALREWITERRSQGNTRQTRVT